MNRLGLLPPTVLEADQKKVYDAYDREIDSRPATFVHSKDEEGCLIGPAGALIHNPEIFQHCNGLRKAILKQLSQSGLPKHVQEVAILVVGSRTQAAYEIYAHSKSSGFPQDYLDDIRSGCCPPELDDKSQMAFEVATELGKPGTLSEATWQKSVSVLGVNGTAALVQYVGFYNFLSTVVNGFDVQLPAAYVSQASSVNSARSSISSSIDGGSDVFV